MRRIAMPITALMLAAFQTSPTPSELPPGIAALTQDAGAARSFDYLALKASGADLRALSGALQRRAMADGGRCLTDGELAVQESLSAAAASPEGADWDADRAAGDDAWARWEVFAQEMANGRAATEASAFTLMPRVRERSAATADMGSLL